MDLYRALFSSLDYKNLRLRNRIVCSPLTTNLATPDGLSTSKHREFWRARARGGVGLIILDSAYPDPGGRGFPCQLGCHDDSVLPGLREIVEAVHSENTAIALQIEHSGAQTTAKVCGQVPVAPSPIADPRHGEIPRTLSVEEIHQLVESFGQAARRCKEAGFDAVEIHGAHGYLVNQFLSPRTNKRTDEYGGDTYARTRFAREIIARTRKLVGEDYTILFRLSAKEGLEDGLDLDEALSICSILAESGVDILDVSAGVGITAHIMGPPAGTPFGPLVDLAANVKKVVHIPVITVGRILDPALANSVIEEGKADLIALGRALIADPDWPNKVKSGRYNEIIPCIGCCGCNARSRRPDIICVVNSRVGLEDRSRPQTAPRSRHVAVIGSGMAGLESARVAAERGITVSVWETGPRIGGLLGLRSMVPGLEEFYQAITYGMDSLGSLGIRVKQCPEGLGKELDNYEAACILLALPGPPISRVIEGFQPERVVQAVDVLAGRDVPGSRVAVLGGGVMGCEVALILANKGYQATVLAERNGPASDTHPSMRYFLLKRLSAADVQVVYNISMIEGSPHGLHVYSDEKDFYLPEIESIVLAFGFSEPKVPPGLVSEDKNTRDIHIIGDAYRASDLAEVVRRAVILAEQL